MTLNQLSATKPLIAGRVLWALRRRVCCLRLLSGSVSVLASLPTLLSEIFSTYCMIQLYEVFNNTNPMRMEQTIHIVLIFKILLSSARVVAVGLRWKCFFANIWKTTNLNIMDCWESFSRWNDLLFLFFHFHSKSWRICPKPYGVSQRYYNSSYTNSRIIDKRLKEIYF